MNERNKYLSVFIVIASLLYIVEGLIPKPLPWLKLGLANIATVVALFFFDFKFLIKMVLIRVFVGAVITATLFTPSFLLSFSGAVSSTVIMYFLLKIFNENISPIGVSIIGAITHLSAQLSVVYLVILKDKDVFMIIPYLLICGVISGLVVGYLAYKVINEIKFNQIITF